MIGAVGWITVGRWVSQKSSMLAPAEFRKVALSTSARSLRPMMVAGPCPTLGSDCRSFS